jgi:hypothetical protein
LPDPRAFLHLLEHRSRRSAVSIDSGAAAPRFVEKGIAGGEREFLRHASI